VLYELQCLNHCLTASAARLRNRRDTTLASYIQTFQEIFTHQRLWKITNKYLKYTD